MTRGLDCNNPFNLETSVKITWVGEIKPTNDPDGVLCTFDTPEHGLRAGFRDLVNQQALHGLNTWSEIITKYAPPTENNTLAYIKALVDATGCAANQKLDLKDPQLLASAGEAVIVHEQGANPYTSAQISQGVQDALT